MNAWTQEQYEAWLAKSKARDRPPVQAPDAKPRCNFIKASRPWTDEGHWKGFAGHKHTAEARKIIAEKARRMWQRPDAYQNQVEYRQEISDRFARNARKRQGYTRCNGGRRADLENRYFRSAWEANYARYLNLIQRSGQIFKWEYEPDTFWFHEIKRGTRSYTPDFKVWTSEGAAPYYEEVKGWLDARSKTQLRRMAQFYPTVAVFVIDEKIYRGIAKTVRPLIPEWEGR